MWRTRAYRFEDRSELTLAFRDPSATSDRERVRELFRTMLPYYLYERAHDWKFLAQQRRVCAMLNGRVGRVLDIGCGPGLMTEALVERGGEVWGVDFLEPALAWARAEAEKASWGDRAHYVAGDAQALPFAAATFDTVIAMGVLEYLSDAFPRGSRPTTLRRASSIGSLGPPIVSSAAS